MPNRNKGNLVPSILCMIKEVSGRSEQMSTETFGYLEQIEKKLQDQLQGTLRPSSPLKLDKRN